MQRITAIEPQKRKGRYNVFLDEEFAFGADKETIFHFGLRKNDELSDEKINEIRDYDEFNLGKKTAFSFLGYKPRTEKELIKKLKEKKISVKNIEKTLKVLKDLKYLDDGQYAKMYLEEKLSRKPAGKRLISMKLAEKGIKKEVIENVMASQYSEEKEKKKAKELLIKYLKKVRAKSDLDKKQKCYRFLLSRGFDYEIVKSVCSIESTD
ncbi:MAG: RecX family transcriptional regulator [Ignavibacteriae bacterium]|nr:RecX family transcriptional regulator [Ignavibacteriota bacterium]